MYNFSTGDRKLLRRSTADWRFSIVDETEDVSSEGPTRETARGRHSVGVTYSGDFSVSVTAARTPSGLPTAFSTCITATRTSSGRSTVPTAYVLFIDTFSVGASSIRVFIMASDSRAVGSKVKMRFSSLTIVGAFDDQNLGIPSPGRYQLELLHDTVSQHVGCCE